MAADTDCAGFRLIKVAFGPSMPTLEAAATAPVPGGMDSFHLGTILSVVVVVVVIDMVTVVVAVLGSCGKLPALSSAISVDLSIFADSVQSV